MTIKDFVNFALPLAVEAARNTGVNVIGMLAQSALETGWGAHTPGNMFFGIKATAGWTGATQMLTTTEIVDGEKKTVVSKFRAYSSPAESFADYAKLIATTPRYRKALQYPAPEQVDSYLYEVAKAGYATGTNYYTTLTRVAKSIEQYATPERIEALKKNS